MRALLIGLGLLIALPAEAGWFEQDRYDPDAPRFGTPVQHFSTQMGVHRTTDVLAKTTWRPAFSQSYDIGVLVVPFVSPMLRVGWSIQGARAPIPDTEKAFAGYRTIALYTDVGLNVEGKWARVFAYTDVADHTVTRGLFGSGWPAVPTRFGHVGGGLELRGGGQIDPDEKKNVTGALLIEVQRSWWALKEPAAHAPSSGWGDTIFVSVGTYTYKTKKEATP